MSNEWQYSLLKKLSAFTCKLSYRTILRIGETLGPLYSLFGKKQKKRGIKNVMIGLGVSEAEAEEVLGELFKNLGRSALEILYMPNLTKEFIDEHIEMHGLAYLDKALAEQRGVVILTAHVGNWEWMGAALAAAGYPSTTIVKKQPNAQVTRLLNEYREMVGLEVFARGGSEMIRAVKAMKQKKLLGFLADQDGYIQGFPVEFLGQESSAVIGPATFAQKFKAPVVPVFAHRKADGIGHVVEILPPLYYEDTGNEQEDLYRLTEATVWVTEEFIKAHPTEWLWFQHRWNTKLHEIENIEEKLKVRDAVHARDRQNGASAANQAMTVESHEKSHEKSHEVPHSNVTEGASTAQDFKVSDDTQAQQEAVNSDVEK
ncbi:lysophospholipid acyltransferase family protein [uncultured Veillonella sp.]|uniref:lysophospholipid acyltransferase family protein n=1 Tax=uncultured Veillonella sp. TaxID=159268 RepID=UPI00260CB7C9|nr:lysophospholipid acyltransferase family protein [uncultured Veillonella sp.]